MDLKDDGASCSTWEIHYSRFMPRSELHQIFSAVNQLDNRFVHVTHPKAFLRVNDGVTDPNGLSRRRLETVNSTFRFDTERSVWVKTKTNQELPLVSRIFPLILASIRKHYRQSRTQDPPGLNKISDRVLSEFLIPREDVRAAIGICAQEKLFELELISDANWIKIITVARAQEYFYRYVIIICGLAY